MGRLYHMKNSPFSGLGPNKMLGQVVNDIFVGVSDDESQPPSKSHKLIVAAANSGRCDSVCCGVRWHSAAGAVTYARWPRSLLGGTALDSVDNFLLSLIRLKCI